MGDAGQTGIARCGACQPIGVHSSNNAMTVYSKLCKTGSEGKGMGKRERRLGGSESALPTPFDLEGLGDGDMESSRARRNNRESLARVRIPW